MYEPGTTLRLREPQSTDDAPYAYDRIEVVGPSPIQHATQSGTPWAGQDAIGYIVKPAGATFGATLDKPYGQLAELYEIESYPTDPQTGEQITPQNHPRHAPSPEQVFAQQAASAAKQRPKAPALQDDAKSPEQVLREAEQDAKPKPAGKTKASK